MWKRLTKLQNKGGEYLKISKLQKLQIPKFREHPVERLKGKEYQLEETSGLHRKVGGIGDFG